MVLEREILMEGEVFQMIISGIDYFDSFQWICSFDGERKIKLKPFDEFW